MKILMKALLVTATLATAAAGAAAEQKQAGKTAGAQAQAAAIARGTGVVKGLDAPSSRIIISHEAIPAVQWPAMTMSFRISKELAQGLKVGQKVEFEFEPKDMDGTITKVKVLP